MMCVMLVCNDLQVVFTGYARCVPVMWEACAT
jgi:hypothetical protein